MPHIKANFSNKFLVTCVALLIGTLLSNVLLSNRAAGYMPAAIGIKSVLYAGSWTRSFFIYELDDATRLKLQNHGAEFLHDKITPRDKNARPKLIYTGWHGPLSLDGNVQNRLSPSQNKTRNIDHEGGVAYAEFRHSPIMFPNAQTAYNNIKEAIITDRAYYTINNNGEVIIIIDPDSGAAAIIEGDH